MRTSPYVTRFDQAPNDQNSEEALRDVLFATNRALSVLRSEKEDLFRLPAEIGAELEQQNQDRQDRLTVVRDVVWGLGDEWFGWTE